VAHPSREALQRLLRPRTIAVVGGSEAEIVANQCDRLGFGGTVWPVNPKRDNMAGRDCLRRLEDLPETPDAVFVAIPAEPSIEAVAFLAAAGAGGIVCFASGFREIGGPGVERQHRLVAAAGAMPMMGPNCHGFVNYLDGAALWPDQHGGKRTERGVALITQSGNMAINLSMQQRSLDLAYLITLGNQAAIGISECIEAVVTDQRVTAIGLHVEGLGDVGSFERAAAAARTAGIPIVALKTGRSTTGAAIALSHTASLAGPDGLYDALFERLGVARVHTVPELLETLKLLSVAGPLAGNRICSMSCSGGEASLMADLAEDRAVDFPPMAADHRERVAATLGDLVSVSNPLDYHTFIWGQEDKLATTFTAMMSGGYDLSMVVLDFPRRDRCNDEDWKSTANAVVRAAQTTGGRAAVLASMQECLPEDVGATLTEQGIAPMMGMAECLTAIECAALIGRAQAGDEPPALLDPRPPSAEGSRIYDEWESKRLLAAAGLGIPDGALVTSATEAVAAAEALGYPVAVKAVSAAIAHKTEAGAIAINLADGDAVDAAATRMHAISGRVLVEKMITDGVAELIVGIDRDAQFGPYLVVGFGGVLVELISDSQTLLLPTDRDQVRAALQSLKTAPMLTGYRGLPVADTDAAVDAIMAVADFAAAHANNILELDVNPLIVRPVGKGAIAADALIRLAEPI
jgi:acyl-CoA synthetase (NDP forming)